MTGGGRLDSDAAGTGVRGGSAVDRAMPHRGSVTGGDGVGGRTFLRRTAIWMPAGVIGMLMLPLAATNRTFGDDWTLHLWLVRQQELNIQANGRPGLFLSARPLGVFYPIFAFAGSGLYTVGAYLALALGDRPIVAYKLLYLGGLCLGYGGMTWLARQVGLRGWRSQMPGLVFVTGTYFVTDMFARGDLAELVAVAAIPFLVAAVTAVTISSRLKARHLLAVVLGVFVLTGSHNITLLCGTIFLTLLALVLLGAYAPSRLSPLPWRRLAAVLSAAAIGAGLNAWYLVADLRYGLGTLIAKQSTHAPPTAGHVPLWRLLDPFTRPARIGPGDIRVSLPSLFVAWAIVVAVVAWRRMDGIGRRLIVLLCGLTVLFAVLAVFRAPWRSLPHVLYNLQFTWRMHSYVLLATALLVMVVLIWQARLDGAVRVRTSAALALIAVFTVGAATWQAWAVPSTYHVNQRDVPAPSHFADIVVADRDVQPTVWFGFNRFRVVTGRVLEVGFAHELSVPVADVRGSTFSGRIGGVGAGVFRTNISASPQLVQITGITPIGITNSGFVVAERVAGAPKSGPIAVTIRQAQTNLLRAGALISLLSLAALVALMAWPLCAWLRSRLTRRTSRMATLPR